MGDARAVGTDAGSYHCLPPLPAPTRVPLQDLRVLNEDYRRKIERQELLIAQRKEYLRLLLKQAAWHKVLEAALAIEVIASLIICCCCIPKNSKGLTGLGISLLLTSPLSPYHAGPATQRYPRSSLGCRG